MPAFDLPKGPLVARRRLATSAMALCLSLAAAPHPGSAQSLDLDSGTTQPPASSASPPAAAGEVKAGIRPVGQDLAPNAQGTSEEAPGSAPAAPANEASAPAIVPLTLEHPKVINTGKLRSGETSVTLFGIEGLEGESAQGLQAYLGQNDKPVNCQAHDGSAFVCVMADGTDVALVALVNGAARTKSDAPDVYRDQELEAQKNRRGIWAKLPPPPETVKHPIVKDTATLTAESKTYVLDGVIGLEAPYSSQLQSYIVGNGDSMTCMPQGPRDHFVCLMPDGTDLAKAALVNGAARVPQAALPAYKAQQLDAVNNRRGYWASAPKDVVALATAPSPPGEAPLGTVEDNINGLNYAGGMPVAAIEGEPAPVFVVYDDDIGWGYYGHDHYWHRAPERYWRHLDHFHHAGGGLRGYEHGHFAAEGHEFHGHPGEARGIIGHEGVRHVEEMHGGEHRMPAEHRIAAEHRESVAHGGAPHAERYTSAPHMGGMHEAAMRAPPVRPGGFGGGFVRPSPMASMGGFHPGGGMSRPMAAAPHVGGGGGGKHK